MRPTPRAPMPCAPPPPLSRQQDELWWLAPAICTPLALLLGYADYAAASLPPVWALGYLCPLALVTGSWLGARTRQQRNRRVRLGVVGCVLAFMYAKCVLAVAYVVAIVGWVFVYGDG